MALEVTFLGKCFLTDLALKWMLLCVTSEMVEELADALEGRLTIADKKLLVLTIAVQFLESVDAKVFTL